MMSAWYKKLKEKLNDNRGSALVLVIIAIAFVGTLVAMLVYLVYFNYLMKFTDRSAKENFYTAESALEVIKAGIEKDVSEAMVVSYYEVMSNNTSDSAYNKQAAFEVEFRNHLEDAGVFNISSYTFGGPVTQTMNTYDPGKLEAYWAEVQRTNAGYDGFKVAATEGAEGAWLETFGWDKANHIVDGAVATDPGVFKERGPIVIYNGSIIEFKNVRVKYIDEKGYVSIIETDIQVETPKINFSNVLSVPRIEEYSLIAGGGIYNGYDRVQNTQSGKYEPTPGKPGADIVVTGSVNGGEDGIYVDGVGHEISFEQKAGDPDTKVYTVTADRINASTGRVQADANNNRPASKSSVEIEDCYEVWANDLYTESATMRIAANCFIQDDLTTDGSYPAVYLTGTSYSGYGTNGTTAKGNSAILINGAHTTLDMSGLDKLELAGHAYVGAIHYYAELDDTNTGDYIEDVDQFWKDQEEEEDGTGTGNTEDDDETRYHPDGTPYTDPNEKEVLMGQSISVKADQLMYMVPVECMGYDGDAQILAKNPMTYNEYLKFATTYEPRYDENGEVVRDPLTNEIVYSDNLRYDVVRLDVIMNKVGASLSSYGASYMPVFRRVNGDILVYYYIKFTTDDKANEFFQDYYRSDPDAFADYLESYVDTYRVNSAITANGSDMLNIAGNMLYMRNGRVYMKEDTYEKDLDIYDSLYTTRQQNAVYFQNLTKYLMKTTDDLSADKLQNDVFTNLTVDKADFALQVAEGKFSKYMNPDGKVVALVINNATHDIFDIDPDPSKNRGALNMSAAELEDVHLVIATGDVRVNVPHFEGLILAGGNIYIGPQNQSIDYDYAQVPLAMTAVSNDGQYVFETIENGVAYANTIGTSDDELRAAIEAQREGDIVRASDLVRYVNWNKE